MFGAALRGFVEGCESLGACGAIRPCECRSLGVDISCNEFKAATNSFGCVHFRSSPVRVLESESYKLKVLLYLSR